MGRRWGALLAYAAGMFLSLPYTRPLVSWAEARLGRGVVLAAVAVLLGLAGGLLLGRLRRTPRACPWPALALAALAGATWGAWRILASSPIGRIHLPEYALLAVLAALAFGEGRRATLGGGAAAAAIGLIDEGVQGVTPGRVFDWWDIALNAASSFLGAAALAWWRWTGCARA
jgi:hypothetical protein